MTQGGARAEAPAVPSHCQSFLAFDFGLKRTGVAIGTRMLRSASPQPTVRAEGEARVIVFTGAGRAFCSGQDLADAQRLGTDVPFEDILNGEYVPLLNAIYDCKLPTIAAVNGPATVHAELALLCDIVLAAEHLQPCPRAEQAQAQRRQARISEHQPV